MMECVQKSLRCGIPAQINPSRRQQKGQPESVKLFLPGPLIAKKKRFVSAGLHQQGKRRHALGRYFSTNRGQELAFQQGLPVPQYTYPQF